VILAEDRGAVAVRSTAGRVLLHLMKTDVAGTLCGRYSVDRILPQDEPLADQTRECQVCRAIADGTNNQRWR